MKFEFSDLYKFIVSVGVILVTLAILGPWLFLREPFDLHLKTIELQQLTETARQTISRRQETVLIATQVWPWLSPLFAILGLVLIFVGIQNWYRNQKALDEKTFAESELAQFNLRNATAKEREANKQAEALEPLTLQEIESGKIEGISTASTAKNIEKTVFDKIWPIASRHEVLVDQIIDDSFFDLILKSRDPLIKSYVVEIKYVSRAFSYIWLKQTALYVRELAMIFSSATKSIPNTALLIVMPNDLWNSNKNDQYLERLSSELWHRRGKHHIEIVAQKQLEEMAPQELAERLCFVL